MQTLISKYGLAAHLALLAVTPLILSPFFTDATVASGMLWLSAAGAVWILLEPSRRNDEMLHDARVRLSGALVRDPLFWVLLALAVFAGLAALNGGMVRTFDMAQGKWIVTDAPCGFLPGCAEGSGLLFFATAVALGVTVEGCRLALGKSARIAFAAVFSVAAAFAGVAAACAHVSWDGSASSPAFAFGFAFLSSIAAAAGIFECKWHRWLLLHSFAVGGSATGLFLFASPLLLFSFAVLGLLLAAGCAVYLAVTQRAADVARFLVVIIVAAIVPILLCICVIPQSVTASQGAVFLSLADIPDCLFAEGFWERRAALSDFAAAFWRGDMWKGCGAETYPLHLWVSGGSVKGLACSAPTNGWWLLLSERGILGAVALAVPFAIMSYSLVRRAYVAVRFGRGAFFPLVALGVLAPLLVGAGGLVDPSVLRPDVILAAFPLYALAASSLPLPRLMRSAEDEEK